MAPSELFAYTLVWVRFQPFQSFFLVVEVLRYQYTVVSLFPWFSLAMVNSIYTSPIRMYFLQKMVVVCVVTCVDKYRKLEIMMTKD